MVEVSERLVAARESFARRDWRAARDGLEDVRATAGLGPDDLDLLGRASWLLGDGTASLAETEVAFARFEEVGAPVDAARMAIRLAMDWFTRGDVAIGTAWLSRARRLLRGQPPHPVLGYLAYVEASMDLDLEGDVESAERAATAVGELAQTFDDEALRCFELVLRGMVGVRSGNTATGFDELDQAMLPVVAGRVEPVWAGDIYCTVIHVCEALGDLSRMRSWTDALQRWASPISASFMYSGVTRVHQLQLISAEGGWDVVEAELGRESTNLVGAHGWLAAAGYTALGDVRRLRGDLVGAEQAYEQARTLGVDPQPGAALLARARGDGAGALESLRVAIAQAGRLDGARLLLPAVDLALEAGDRHSAEQHAERLRETARFHETPGLRAWAEEADSAVSLAAGDAAGAIPSLERAAQVYRDQRFRYGTARVHERLAHAHRLLGDGRDVAEAATALAIYRRLGAGPDVARLEGRQRPGGLTAREEEILAFVASGATNRQVAERLVISEKTVGRHLANIYAKVGVGSRTAASAWAHAHGIHAMPHDRDAKMHDAPDEEASRAFVPSGHDNRHSTR